MFNTTILESGFYLRMEGESSGSPRVYFDELAGAYTFIHDTALSRLQDATVLDRYYRLLCPPMEGLIRLKAYYAEDAIHYEMLPNSFAEMLTMDILYSQFNLPYQTPQWLLCYPPKLMALPLVNLEEAIVQHDAERIQKMGNRQAPVPEMDIAIPISKWANDGIISDFRLFTDVRSGRLHMEFTFYSQYGNRVVMAIVSNTRNMDEFIQRISDEGIFADMHRQLTLHISRTSLLTHAHKLLFRVTYYTDGEEVKEDDTTDNGEGIPEEDREVVHV